MLVPSGLTMVSLLTVASALASNSTVHTVTVTQTFWSTIVSTPSCPAPTTVTLCNPLSTASTSTIAGNANIIYQTLSECHAGQVITIGSEVTTLAQATTWTVEKTISDLVFIPDFATDIDYSAVATVTNIIHPSSMTGMSGQVVVCRTGTTTVGSDHVVLTDCPCTVQSTVLSLTATGLGAVPTALVPSTNYIVKIIYVYVIETIVEQISTTMTATATSILTTIQTGTATDTSTTTTTRAPRPTIVSVDSVTFLLEYDTSYEGAGIGNLRKRQASILPGISVELNACLAQCAQQAECVAASLDENTSSCSPLVRFNALSRRNADGNVFAIVIFRPSASTGPPASTSSSNSAMLPGSTDRAESSASTRSLVSISSGVFTVSSVSTTSTNPTYSGTTGSNPISGSSSRSSSSSALYPISNSSLLSTTSESSYRSNSSLSVPVFASSNVLTRSTSISSSRANSTSTSSPDPSTLPSIMSSTSSLSTLGNATSISTTLSPGTTSVNSINSTFNSTFSLGSTSSVANSSAVSTTSTSSRTSSSVAPFDGCAVASNIAGYAPAMSYCSSVYPLTATTTFFGVTTIEIITTSAPATTLLSNITLTTETAVQTNEATITKISYFPTELTVTETTTTTRTLTDSTVFVRKRQTTATVQASMFTSILNRPSSDVANVCSCLQTPTITTVTNTQTALSTTTITPIVSGNYTITPPIATVQTTETITDIISVTTITATTTSTEVVTATATQTTASGCSVSPAAAVRESVVTLTSTYANTYTEIFTTTISSTQTVTTCTPSAFPAGRCLEGVYTLGTKYYNQLCGSSLAGGATVLVLPAAQIAYCNQYCSVYSTLCSGYNYNTAARVCTFLSGSALLPSPAVAYQAAVAYTTNPCVATSTAIEVQYSTQISSSDVTSVYESTITLSTSESPCASSPVVT
ncbi:hypothetical protein AUEXF2481DRAFT_9065 [Aureobasidium subglaciale EXF-2481]|uniref:Apple domain-containing protein n=1 Tax=Aureobasidium subglaciale (strain EXF-2481) TaxID=1043005 RepID=A0A074Y4Q8_AURSE|nr:uncharacterized protein AUEXF2481DRAFT_9065 [Aureobasidium subglaciale EXF-2481]KEQ90944.1 hypothetical protein AUEXF2481DRAFT_9065 [Aureobasidium subglaciale EXF-2481]